METEEKQEEGKRIVKKKPNKLLCEKEYRRYINYDKHMETRILLTQYEACEKMKPNQCIEEWNAFIDARLNLFRIYFDCMQKQVV